MPLTLPNPTVPANGQPLDATPMLQNILAIAQAIQQFDGSQIVAGSVAAAALVASANPNTLVSDISVPFVIAGCIWSTVSGLQGTMTGGSFMYNGVIVTANSVGSNTFAANSDTYVDIDKNDNVTYNAVANNATSPALTANSIRVAKVITGASITSIIQYGVDAVTTNGQVNYIYNTSPNAAPIFVLTNGGSAGGTFWYKNQGGEKSLRGFTNVQTIGGAGPASAALALNLPASFFNSINSITATPNNQSGAGMNTIDVYNQNTTTVNLLFVNISGTANQFSGYVSITGF